MKKTPHSILMNPDLMEQQARDLFKRGKFRQAREIVKELCKIDKNRYFAFLLDCYQSQAEQYISKGMENEAEQIYKQIELLTGKPAQKATPVANKTTAKPFTSMQQIVTILLSADTHQDERIRAADQLVLGFKECEVLQQQDARLHEHLIAIICALEKVSETQYQSALDSIAAVNITSPFAHWRLFVKGMVAYYQCDDAKAEAAFKRIPESSLISQVSSSFSYLLSVPLIENIHKNTDLVKTVCHLFNKSEIADSIARAEYLHGTGRVHDSYFHLREKIKNFPDFNDPFLCDISLIYFKSAEKGFNERDMQFYDRFFQRLSTASYKNDTEGFLLRIMIFELEDDIENISSHLSEVLQLSKMIFGSSCFLESVLYKKAGQIASSLLSLNHGPFNDRFSKKEASMIGQFLETSIAKDPTDLETWKLLLSIQFSNKAKLKSTVDRMTKVFPNDLDVLKESAAILFGENDFKKASKVFKKISELDPHDPKAKNFHILSLIKLAEHQATRFNSDQCFKLMNEALSLTDNQNKTLLNSEALITCRMAVLYKYLQNKEMVMPTLEKARTLFDEFSINYFTFCYSYQFRIQLDFAFLCKDIKTCLEKDASLKSIIFAFKTLLSFDHVYSLRKELDSLCKVTAIKCKHKILSSEAQVLWEIFDKFINFNVTQIRTTLLKNQEKFNPDHYYFRFFSLEKALQFKSLTEKDKAALNEIAHEATNEGNQVIARKAQSLIEHGENMRPDFFPRSFDDELDEDDDFLDELEAVLPKGKKGGKGKTILEQIIERLEGEANSRPQRPVPKVKVNSTNKNSKNKNKQTKLDQSRPKKQIDSDEDGEQLDFF